jgi:hypothetical protein
MIKNIAWLRNHKVVNTTVFLWSSYPPSACPVLVQSKTAGGSTKGLEKGFTRLQHLRRDLPQNRRLAVAHIRNREDPQPALRSYKVTLNLKPAAA